MTAPGDGAAARIARGIARASAPCSSRRVDYLGLTVLGAGYPIPAQAAPVGGLEGSLAFFPHVGPGDRLNGRVDGGAMSAVPLLEATFVPLCGAASGRTVRRLGSGRFAADPGARRNVVVSLSREGRKRLRGKRRLKVVARLAVKNGPGAERRVTLVR